MTGERLKELRKHLGLTQAKLGERLGASRDVIANIENNRVELDITKAKLIVAEFNVNEDWLRTGEGEMFNELDKESKIMSWVGEILGDKSKSFQRAFVTMLASLDEDKWELIAEMAKTLYEAEQKEKE